MKMFLKKLMFVTLIAAMVGSSTSVKALISDDFESYAVGAFPFPKWSDVGTVIPAPPIPPMPSALIIRTTDAFGNTTKALSTVGDLSSSKGVYIPIPVSSFYSLAADVRVDRYSDNPAYTTADWPMQLTFAQGGIDSFATTPQAGLYASCFTQGWRLFLISSSGGPFADIDLSAAANVGTWYHLKLTLDTTTGAFRSVIMDIVTATLLSDQTNVIGGWQPNNGLFDSFAFFGGELSPDNTIGNIGVVDNVNITSTPIPEPTTMLLFGSGLIGLAGYGRRRLLKK